MSNSKLLDRAGTRSELRGSNFGCQLPRFAPRRRDSPAVEPTVKLDGSEVLARGGQLRSKAFTDHGLRRPPIEISFVD